MTSDDRQFLYFHALAWAQHHRTADYDPRDYAEYVMDLYGDEDDLADVPGHRAMEPGFLAREEARR